MTTLQAAPIEVATDPPLPPGQPNRRQLATIYTIGVAVPIVAAGWLLSHGSLAGSHRDASRSVGAVPFNLDRIILTLAILTVVTQLGGFLASRVGQPRVVGQATAGLLLGPSMLGQVSPAAETWLHGAGADHAIDLLSQLGVIFFLFLVGREVVASREVPRTTTAMALGSVMIAVPLFVGVAAAWFGLDGFRPAGLSRPVFALFIGLLMATTALPVLAHVLAERGLLRSRLGSLAVSGAVTGDVVIWGLLAVALALASGASVATAALNMAGAVAFLVAMWFGVRPVLHRFLGPAASGSLVPVVVLGVLLVSAVVTDSLGLHTIFGAFLAGMVVPGNAATERVTVVISSVAQWLLPLFFAVVGSRTVLQSLEGHQMLVYGALILALAVLAKVAVGLGVGRALRLPWRDGAALAAMINCRGLTELLILNVGLAAGLIDERLCALFVVMAIVTTAMTGPALGYLGLGRRPTAGRTT